MQSIFKALVKAHGYADGQRIFAWFCTWSQKDRDSVAQMTEGETVADVVEAIVFCKKASGHQTLKPTELEAVPLFEEEEVEDTQPNKPNKTNQKSIPMETRREIAKRLATAKAQVTRYTHKLEEFDAAQAARKEQRAKARKEHAKQLTDADKQPLQFGDYSTKCLIVYGGTKSRLDKFTELKNKGLCSYNSALRYDGKGAHSESAQPKGGWLFYKSKTADVKALKALFN